MVDDVCRRCISTSIQGTGSISHHWKNIEYTATSIKELYLLILKNADGDDKRGDNGEIGQTSIAKCLQAPARQPLFSFFICSFV